MNPYYVMSQSLPSAWQHEPFTGGKYALLTCYFLLASPTNPGYAYA